MTSKLLNIKSIKELRISRKPGVYKWWCKEDLLRDFLKKLGINYSEAIGDIEQKNFGNYNYFCIYVGDTETLRSRIIGNHIGGDTSNSTLRKTIGSILYADVSRSAEEKIDNAIDDMIVQIFYDFNCFEEAHKFQNKEINEKFRPLNNKDINRNNDIYLKYGYHNTKLGMRSNKITSLRKTAKK